MQQELRDKFNRNFTTEKYAEFLSALNSVSRYPADFRVAESPLFLSSEFANEIQNAANEIAVQLQTEDFKKKSEGAIPQNLNVPGETAHPLFIQIDFAVSFDENGNYIPKLIELQGFPSLYGYQYFLGKITRQFFDIPENYTTYFNGVDDITYVNLLKKIIVSDKDPENVILLEVEPEKQKTRIDFACTEKLLGIKTVSLTDVKKSGNKLYYINDGKEIPVERIYNRIIFDELIKKDIKTGFSLMDELNIEWAGHPNWFFKISKYSLPVLKGKYVPECYYLHSISDYPDDLQNYVLKPLYSFAGSGVEVDVTPEMLNNIQDKSAYILQKKMEYAPILKTPDGFAKAEIRMMFLWDDKPLLVNNLVRLSKGKMMGVAFNKDKTWVGSSIAFHPL